MTKWKLRRQMFGDEEFTFSEGEEVSFGRGAKNTVTFSSIVISRNHCVISFQENKAFITDLKSSNGTYVGLIKIPPNTPHIIKDTDIIGFGWTKGVALTDIDNKEKYVFKLSKEESEMPSSIKNRIKFQSEIEMDDQVEIDNIEKQIATCFTDSKLNVVKRNAESPDLEPKIKLKRKEHNEDPVIVISDSDVEEISTKIKNESKCIELEKQTSKIEPKNIKSENEVLEYEAFDIKQEHIDYDDKSIAIDLSDSDSESEQWLLRLSQSSPGKPFMKIAREIKSEVRQEDCSYSQLDDFVSDDLMNKHDNEEEFLDDLISIPPQPCVPKKGNEILQEGVNEKPVNKTLNTQVDKIPKSPPDNADNLHDLIVSPTSLNSAKEIYNVDGANTHCSPQEITTNTIPNAQSENQNTLLKRTLMIEPQAQLLRRKSNHMTIESKPKSSSKHGKVKKHSSSKRHISNSQKEERKKKLKEIASKEKEYIELKSSKELVGNSSKAKVNAKVTTSNRGAFLSDQTTIASKKRKEDSPKRDKTKENKADTISSNNEMAQAATLAEPTENIENTNKKLEKNDIVKHKTPKHDEIKYNSLNKSTQFKSQTSSEQHVTESRVPLKSLKPLTEKEESYSGKPFNKVQPLKKPKKKVHFSDSKPEVHVFEIEPGNKLKKTSLVKTTLLDVPQSPIFSKEKTTLMTILRWNPQWLEEQMKITDPPPILGHNNTPLAIFHSFQTHSLYVQQIGDLILMEIWECLTQAYMRVRTKNNEIQMRIEAMPPMSSIERCYELINFSVNISLLKSDTRNMPRVGEILWGVFGLDNARTSRFFFVSNVRCLPSPPNNIRSFYSVSLYATFTDKMATLRPGEIIMAKTLSYINNELLLFEAMQNLAESPLRDAILRPEPRHFFIEPKPAIILKSQWTSSLNESQQTAVTASVSAALGDRPSIQMVQGPPGTGKSSVICAIVMSYFYDATGTKKQSRGKILICATSNAAVDELVIRLLNIRQTLPKYERFRMVRVGRVEAMHPRACDVSSQQLAQRDAQRLHADPAHPALTQEISHLEAKINMWKTKAQDTSDKERIAYCETRISQLNERIALLRGGGGGGGEELRPEQLARAERRILEGADIVVSTLSSAGNHKMRSLHGRIALCIVDEAGQAIEPETLIPLTLGVTRLTLIGDPQQLPGYICSQRAKKHGLSESLFARLTSCAEEWPEGNPVVLLNQQYRMHPEIADYPNRSFYGGKIRSMPPHKTNLNIPPYSIVSISSGDKGQGSSGANEMEAWGVTRLVLALRPMVHAAGYNLAVITPYNAHKDLIKKNLRILMEPSDRGVVEVNTIDSFQGQERDVVVVSLARSQGVGFLTDAGRMNVMLTRAKHALLLCLNPHATIKNNQWRTLIEDAQKRNLYRTLPNKVCQPPGTGQNYDDADVLKYITY